MTSRLWPVLPLVFAISQKLSGAKESTPEIPASDIAKMLHGALLLSAQAIFSK